MDTTAKQTAIHATKGLDADELLAHALCARNQAQAGEFALDEVAPCTACYMNTFSTNEYLKTDPHLAEHIYFRLEEEQLHFRGTVEVYHPLGLLAKDVGPEAIWKSVTHPLAGLRVAAHYGWKTIHPRKSRQTIEQVEQPHFFGDLVDALGATPVEYPYKRRCCVGSLAISNRRAALSLARNLLQHAIDRGASVIASGCPMCQVNLECHQQQVKQEFGTGYSMPVLYFAQLLGQALGVSPKRPAIGRELVQATPPMPFIGKRQSGVA